ncbi:MAG: 2-hydroxyacid dehydrogenase [Lachnospiraceae bacterium]|nr:2-hydroxyacid dehydrogenase [Lachnospiraceae bacterium]
MKILVFDTKKYDLASFRHEAQQYPKLQLEFLETDLNQKTAELTHGFDAVCAFVNSEIGAKTLNALSHCGVKLLLMRCAGFNNIDLPAAKKEGITILRVPGYSPEAVAEHAMALTLAVCRRLHKSYIKVRENNFSLVGLTGINLHGKTAGIVGTGKIGAAMCRICRGFGMRVIAYDRYHNPDLDFVTYTEFSQVLSESDLISLHCPLTDDNYHMINRDAIRQMKDQVILINTSRGALIDTEDLIQGIQEHKFFGVGLDVYEEETKNVFENREDVILENCIVGRLLSFPNVIVTSHQGFLTQEALMAISRTTLQNAMDFLEDKIQPQNMVSA